MKNEGGQAFACAAENGHQPGMTMRQYYKAMALQGYISNESQLEDIGMLCDKNDRYTGGDQFKERLAIKCGSIADAMIKEDQEFLEKNEPK